MLEMLIGKIVEEPVVSDSRTVAVYTRHEKPAAVKSAAQKPAAKPVQAN